MSQAGWTAAAIVTVLVAWLAVVWAQGFQKYQDHASQLFKDFDDSGAIDAALARIDSQQVDPALVAVIKVANDLRDQAAAGSGNPPEMQDILGRDEVAQARTQLADSMRSREEILEKYDRLKLMARRSRESALSHMPCVILAVACFFFLDQMWQTVGVTVFALLAVVSFVGHFVFAFMFGRQREEFQQCLKPRGSPGTAN